VGASYPLPLPGEGAVRADPGDYSPSGRGQSGAHRGSILPPQPWPGTVIGGGTFIAPACPGLLCPGLPRG